MMQRLAILASFLLSAVPVQPANADDCTGPCLDVSGSYELDGDLFRSSDPDAGHFHDIYPNLDTTLALRAGNGLSLNTEVLTEPVIDITPGGSRVFGDAGVYLETLYVQYDTGDVSLFAGKIHPVFGRAWDIAPGIHSTDLAEEYELSERNGGGANYSFDMGDFQTRIEASAFTIDRTALSGSLITSRPRATLDDGGAGNTSGISSVAVSLDGCKGADPDSCNDDGDIGYQFAAAFQKGGLDSAGDEFSIAASLNKTFKLGEEQDLKFLAESVWFSHFNGSAQDALFLTGSGAWDIGPLTFSTTYSQQHLTSGGGEAASTEYLIDTSALYKLDESINLGGETWSVGAGYTYDHAPDETTHIFALSLTADFEATTKF